MPENLEHEVRFRIDDLDGIIQQLLSSGAIFVTEFMQIRSVFDTGSGKGTWLRLRKGEVTTLALKRVTDQGTEETEVVVDSYDQMLQILKNLGLNPKAEHQNYRREFTFNHATLSNALNISLDTWPEIGHVLEVEGEDYNEVALAIGLLGLSSYEAASPVWDVYVEDGKSPILDRDLHFTDEEISEWNLE